MNPRIVTGAGILLGFVIRLCWVAAPDLWSDEAMSWIVASAAPSEFLDTLVEKESKPPLYYAALHVWIRIFGDSEAALRTMSALCWPPLGILLAVLGRSLCGRAAPVPLFLCALSPVLVHYGVEARPYAMLVCAQMLFLWLALRADEDPSLRNGIALAGAAFLVLCLQFTGLLFLVPVTVALALRRRDLRAGIRLFAPQAAAAVLYGAFLLILMSGVLGQLSQHQSRWWAAPPSAVQVLSAPVRLLAPVQSWVPYLDLTRPSSAPLLLASALLLVLSVLGLAVSPKRRLLLAAGPGVLALVAVYSLIRANLLFERYYIGCAPLLYLGVGVALDFLWERRKLLLPAAAAAQVLLLCLLPPYAGGTGYRAATSALLARDPGPLTLVTGGWDGPAVRYYCRKESGRVQLRDGREEVPEDGRPVYYLRSDSWGDRTGRVSSGAAVVYEGGRIKVVRLR